MKLHQLFVVSILFFQSFIGLGMHGKYPEELWKIIQIGNANASLCELGRQQIINNCRIQLAQKNFTKVNTETLELENEIKDLQTNNLTLQTEGTILLDTINKLEAETKDLQKKLVDITKEKTIRPVHIQTTAVRSGKFTKKVRQSAGTSLTSREKLNGLKILKGKYNVRETPVLLDKLKEEADNAYYKNNPNFDKKNHFFRQKINELYGYIFCPCTNQMEIVPYDFLVTLPRDFGCSDRCQFYPDKDTSSDSAVDTSTEIESESDTEEDNLNPIMLSKAEIEKIAD